VGACVLLARALGVANVSAVVFVVSRSLPWLLVGRLINWIAIGIVVSTATDRLTELHAVGRPEATPCRAQLIASAIPVGGLGVGALVAGLFAQWVAHPLTVPYLVFLAALLFGTQILTAGWPITCEFEAGMAGMLVGLALAVLAMWLNPPSLGLFIAGSALIGARGKAATLKGAVATVIRISAPGRIAESVAGLFLASFVGISLPVVGAGITLSRLVSPKASLLGFAIAVSVGIALSAIRLPGRTSAAGGGEPAPARRSTDSPDKPPIDNPNERRAA